MSVAKREEMVRTQLVERDITDKHVLDAMRKVQRELFVPKRWRSDAYDDNPLPIGHDQTISQPYMVALMTQELELTGKEKVLEVGTGSGYQGAILAECAKEVYTIERKRALLTHAKRVYQRLGYKNIHCFEGDGTLGLPEHAPYGAIMVTAASYKVPKPLLEQLKVGGILLIPLGDRWMQELVKVRKKTKSNDRGLEQRYVCACRFVPLLGDHAW